MIACIWHDLTSAFYFGCQVPISLLGNVVIILVTESEFFHESVSVCRNCSAPINPRWRIKDPENRSNFVLFADGAGIPVGPLSRAKMGGFLERLHGTAFVTQIWQNATNLQNASDRHRFFEGKNGAPTTLERLHGTAFVTQICRDRFTLHRFFDNRLWAPTTLGAPARKGFCHSKLSSVHRFFLGKNGAPTTLSGFYKSQYFRSRIEGRPQNLAVNFYIWPREEFASRKTGDNPQSCSARAPALITIGVVTNKGV